MQSTEKGSGGRKADPMIGASFYLVLFTLGILTLPSAAHATPPMPNNEGRVAQFTKIVSAKGSPKFSASSGAGRQATSGRCTVTVTYIKVGGHQENEEFSYGAKDRLACKALADGHRENFSPQWIVKKRVVAKWWPK